MIQTAMQNLAAADSENVLSGILDLNLTLLASQEKEREKEDGQKCNKVHILLSK